jgi:hypothetical protein
MSSIKLNKLPINILLTYLIFTVILYVFGPIKYPSTNRTTLLVFLFTVNLFLYFGYKTYLHKQQNSEHGAVNEKLRQKFLKVFKFCVIFTLFVVLLKLIYLRGSLTNVYNTILNPGAGYNETQSLNNTLRFGENLSASLWVRISYWLSTLLSAFHVMSFPLGIYYYKRLCLKWKLLFISSIGFQVIWSIGTGTQSGLAYFLVYSFPFICRSIYSYGSKLSFRKLVRVLKSQIIFCLLVSGVIFGVIFYQYTRAADKGLDTNSVSELAGPYADIYESKFTNVLPANIQFGFLMLCKYISHGYCGLELAFQLPFEWTFGLGWSLFLQETIGELLLGESIYLRSYLYRSEITNGWKGLTWWSTIFPWLAGDVSFFGIPIIMFFIGRWYAKTWSNLIIYNQPITYVLMGHLTLLLIMIPANNAIGQSMPGLISTITIILLNNQVISKIKKSSCT